MKQRTVIALFSLFLMFVLVGCSKSEDQRAAERGDRWLEHWGYASQLEALKDRFHDNHGEATSGSTILEELVARRIEIEYLIKKKADRAFGEGHYLIQKGEWIAHYHAESGARTIGPALLVYVDTEPE